MACGRFSRPREVKKLVPVREQELIALRPLIMNQALGVLVRGIPGILNICADCEPSARCRFDFYAASRS